MRKFTLSAGALLLVLSASLASASCNKQDSDSKNSETKTSTGLTTTKDTTNQRESALAPYLRYVETQRILLEYTLAQEVAKEDSIAQIQLASLQNQLSASINNKMQQIQEKAQRGGYINESAYNADVASLSKQQSDAENRMAQRQRDYATDLMNRQAQMHDSIKSVIDAICAKYQLDAVLTDQSGLYFNPSLDITDEVITELNRRYKPSK
ncbi:MAG: OmpH family outer membrane protein [Muribaculaceae bacterium]|nr:OmpH family outer membrane protein [Muribaculaceae bacterium]